MAETQTWQLKGDWFDVCRCTIACPCEFAQAPTDDFCEGVLVWHVNSGRYGDVVLDGFTVVGIGTFRGNLWAGNTKVTIGLFIDERANQQQREALQAIFGGQAGGFPAEFAKFIGEIRGIEFAPIEFEIAEDLAYWRARIPGKIEAAAEALTGPMTPPGARVQTLNAPGSEVGPGAPATWGVATADRVDAMGFNFDWKGRSSKHIPFSWSA